MEVERDRGESMEVGRRGVIERQRKVEWDREEARQVKLQGWCDGRK